MFFWRMLMMVSLGCRSILFWAVRAEQAKARMIATRSDKLFIRIVLPESRGLCEPSRCSHAPVARRRGTAHRAVATTLPLPSADGNMLHDRNRGQPGTRSSGNRGCREKERPLARRHRAGRDFENTRGGKGPRCL